jgi:large subunit ribosomal protein L10
MSKVGFGKMAKQLFVKRIQEDLKSEGNLFVTQFSNIKASALNGLRKDFTKSKSRFRVVKNSLGCRAIESTPYKDLVSQIDGQCGFAISNEDPSRMSKMLVKFGEDNKGFKIKGALVDGQVFGWDRVKFLATLPSRDELLALVMMRIQSPVYGVVNVLSGVTRSLVNVLYQLKSKKEK